MAYPISKFWFYPSCRLFIRRIKGSENIPINSNFIIVSNHEKLIDPLYIIYAILKKLNEKVHFLATPTWWFLGDKICRKWAGCIPILSTEQAFDEMKKCLKEGCIVGIFPEGHLNAEVRYPKTGAVRLAVETKTLILPIGLKSSYVPFSSSIIIGKPILLGKNKNIKKQAIDIMGIVYKLRESS